MPEEWLFIIIEVFSSPINVAFVPEWPGSSTLSVGLREATVTATSRFWLVIITMFIIIIGNIF